MRNAPDAGDPGAAIRHLENISNIRGVTMVDARAADAGQLEKEGVEANALARPSATDLTSHAPALYYHYRMILLCIDSH